MAGEDPFEETRRELERLFGYPPGAFDPARNFFRDIERINRALGEGFKLFQEVIGPEQVLDRIKALHPDQAPLLLPKPDPAIFRLPYVKKLMYPLWPDKPWRRD